MRCTPGVGPKHQRHSWEGDDVVDVLAATATGDIMSSPAAGAPLGTLPAEPLKDLTLRECVVSLNFWLLWVVFAIGAGCGLQLINNIGKRPARLALPTPPPFPLPPGRCVHACACVVSVSISDSQPFLLHTRTNLLNYSIHRNAMLTETHCPTRTLPCQVRYQPKGERNLVNLSSQGSWSRVWGVRWTATMCS